MAGVVGVGLVLPWGGRSFWRGTVAALGRLTGPVAGVMGVIHP
jgi:hypothetical protein